MMASDAMIYAEVHELLDHPVEIVWLHVAAFGAIDRWVDGVTRCEMTGEGPGAVRIVRLGERQVCEQLEEIDPAAYRLRYQILPPHLLPASNVRSEIRLIPLGGGRTEMVWCSEATEFDVPPEQLGAMIETFYRRSIEGLRRLLDRG
jgi:hypothetical protein